MGSGEDDDPDSLVNKRIVSVGELIEGQLQIALTKLEKTTKERIGAKEADKVTAKNVTNNKLITNQFKSFFNTSKLSQFMDQINPLAEVSNKRRVTSLGPGGLSRDTRLIRSSWRAFNSLWKNLSNWNSWRIEHWIDS
ncbi:hypothetical protein [Mycoplasmopsis cynos]|uniref:hypothetical protein n=1 Tax=Mycoplasmopsis cynos TaxID=171284 RepID=UPI0024CD342A|nr:hypothetical protein [Mycoplasmopsis cynos]WAM04203.1 hypothetical protein ONA01_03925 [Mycoplasmopsis cynos]